MATVLTPFDIGSPDPSQTSQNRSVGTSPTFNATPLSPGGGSSVATPGAGNAGLASGAKPLENPNPTTSGGFQNIQKYLNANQGFNQAQGGLAGEIANNVTGQANQANQAVQGAFNNFNTAATNASNAFNPNSAQGAANFTSLNNIAGNGGANAYSDLQANPNDAANATALLQANYAGPTQINPSDLTNLQQQYGSNLSNLGQETGSEAGRFNLLNQMFGNNTYSQGQQSLDNAFLQNNAQQANQLKGLQNISNAFNQNINNTATNAQQIGQQNTVMGQQANQQANQLFNSDIGSTNGPSTTPTSIANPGGMIKYTSTAPTAVPSVLANPSGRGAPPISLSNSITSIPSSLAVNPVNVPIPQVGSGILGAIQSNVNQFNNTYSPEYAAIQAGLTPGAGNTYSIPTEVLNAIGLNGFNPTAVANVPSGYTLENAGANNLYGYNLGTALQAMGPQQVANLQNTATQQQINNYGALEGLLGNTNLAISGTASAPMNNNAYSQLAAGIANPNGGLNTVQQGIVNDMNAYFASLPGHPTTTTTPGVTSTPGPSGGGPSSPGGALSPIAGGSPSITGAPGTTSNIPWVPGQGLPSPNISGGNTQPTGTPTAIPVAPIAAPGDTSGGTYNGGGTIVNTPTGPVTILAPRLGGLMSGGRI